MEYAHFLSRLSRVSLDHVELSLSLYRDPGLTQQLLREVAPDNVKRVAVSLADPVKGPFLVLSRKGHFVTCLGEGMVPNGLRVVTRAKLDSVFTRVTDLRTRFDIIHAQTRREGTVREVLLRLFRSGSRFSREDYQTLNLWSPLLGHQLVKMWKDRFRFATESRDVLSVSMRRGRHLPEKLLRHFWSACYALGHITTLICDDGLRPWVEKTLGEQSKIFGTLPFYTNIASVALRGVWASNRLGRRLVSPLKRVLLDENRSFLEMQSAFLSLAALGFGHQRLNAEISKFFQRLGNDHEDPKNWNVFGAETQHNAEHLRMGRAHLLRVGKTLPKDSPYCFKQEEDIPEELARTCAANLSDAVTTPTGNELGPACLLPLVPWVARAKGEDLYLPREVVRHAIAPYTPQAAINLLQRWTSLYIIDAPAPVRVESKPGRNEPCECGSGQKFKRCHGQ